MRFRVEESDRMAGGAPRRVVLLTNEDRSIQAEIWPDNGCNCLRWRVPGPNGPMELLYAAPDWESNPVSTRSGIPILFPFPNRIRDGSFIWDGHTYQLPLNDPARKNAIHGFACRRPWHAVRSAGQDDLATFTAEFQACADSTQELHLWPGDYRLTMRFLLTPDSLSLSATVHNPCDCPVPLGLGYHPYFSVPLAPGAPAGDCLISVPAKSIWELHENLPTGKKLAVDAAQNLRAPRRFADLQLDDLYTDLDSGSPDMVLHLLGSVHQAGIGTVELWTSGAFRELVAFTPPHREAVCLEPYTCTTDAINLQQQGIDAGLMVFEPGETRTLFVVMRFVPSSIRS